MKPRTAIQSLVGLFCICTSVLITAHAESEVTETSLLAAEAGATGTVIGAVVEEVKPGETGTILLLSVPEDVSTDQQIILLSPDGKEVRQSARPVIIDAYDEGRTGIRLFVDKQGQFEFRLRLVDISNQPQ